VLSLEHGTLSPGRPADITLIDPHEQWVVRAAQFRSKSRNTPFEGQTFTGRVVAAIVDGEVRFRKN
jgi:dihydroorotase